MTSRHTKGVVNDARGKVEETVGRGTGDKGEEAKGKVRQVQGHLQQGLGDVGGCRSQGPRRAPDALTPVRRDTAADQPDPDGPRNGFAPDG